MKIWTRFRSLGLAALALGPVAIAEEDIASKMINKETNGAWYIQPEKPKAKHIKADVPGEHAFRVKAHKGVNPWDVQASSPVAGAINEGDVIMLNYFARAEEPAEGGSSLTARIQLAGAPYTSVLDMSSKITGEWKSYCAFRVASASVPEKKGSVSIHLATAKQVVDLGPVLVFNFGKGYDTAKLKFCDG
jgi:hypothetical protein